MHERDCQSCVKQAALPDVEPDATTQLRYVHAYGHAPTSLGPLILSYEYAGTRDFVVTT